MTDPDTDWYGPSTATFGDRVTGAREAAGMSQAELARRIGVRKSTLVGWEDDMSEPRANKLSMLAGLLNVSIVWLLTGEGDGVEAPEEEPRKNTDFAPVLKELRALQTTLRDTAQRAAQLEKTLRRMERT